MVTVTGVTEAGNYRRDFRVAWEVQNPLVQIPSDKTQHHVCGSCI